MPTDNSKLSSPSEAAVAPREDGASRRVSFPAYYRAAIVGCGLILLIVAVVGVAYTNVLTTARSAHALADVYQPALRHLLGVEQDLHDAQVVFGNYLAIPNSGNRGAYEMRFRDHVARARQQFAEFQALVPGLPDPGGQQETYLGLLESWTSLSEVAFERGGQLSEMQYGELVIQYAELRAVLHSIIEDRLSTEMNAVGMGLVEQSDLARKMLAATLAVALLLGGGVTVAGVRAIRNQHVEILAEKSEREYEASRREFEHRLHRAFELVQSEAGALGIVHDALAETLEPHQYGELLIADSSVAHLSRVVTVSPEGEKRGCSVSEPQECPAIRRNARMVFSSNDVFETCPYLRNRGDGACSAACLPVSIMGRTTGVLRVVGPAGDVPDDTQLRALGSITAATGDELGLIRAFATKNEQANTDTLTGLSNRRSLESKIVEVSSRGEFAIAFIDIDRFKMLNDAHGHETGDRALRLFADVLRGVLRPNDLAARWGGEEFVLVLPRTSADKAVPVLERVREQLEHALAPAMLPGFTISCGVSDSSRGTTFQEIVAQADEALLRAKRAGADRIEIAAGGDSERARAAHDGDGALAESLVDAASAEAAPDAGHAGHGASKPPTSAPARKKSA